MSTGAEIVVEVQSKNAQQVSLVEYDDVFQTLSADGSNETFTIRILPGGLRRANDFLDSHVSDAMLKHVAIDSITIANQKPGRRVIGECLDHLLCRPFSRWVSDNVEMDDVLAVMTHHDEGEEYAKLPVGMVKKSMATMSRKWLPRNPRSPRISCPPRRRSSDTDNRGDPARGHKSPREIAWSSRRLDGEL
jgi:hypothetical protein